MSEALFFLRKVVSAFVYPPTFCLLAALVGIGLMCTRRFRRIGGFLSFGALVFLFVLSIPAFQAPFLHWVEPEPMDAVELPPEVAGIVVLGAGVLDRPEDQPGNQRLLATGLARAVEGVRLARLLPDCPLIFTGGTIGERPASSEAMADFATEFGVSPERVRALRDPRSTVEEARETRMILGEGARIILVTSATHMARARALFESEGLVVFAAPTDFLSDNASPDLLDFLPSAFAWESWQRIFHEWYGQIWAGI